MRNFIGTQYAQLAHCFKPHVFALVGDVFPSTIFTIGAVDDLVVDIGDVRHEPDFQARPGEVAAQNVVHQCGSPVPQVGWPVHRGATEVDAHLARLAQSQGFHTLCGGVIEVQHSDQPTIYEVCPLSLRSPPSTTSRQSGWKPGVPRAHTTSIAPPPEMPSFPSTPLHPR